MSDLLAAGDEAGLRSRLAGRISFGTAGLRGKMCAGFAFMNELTVTQASQGLAVYLLNGSADSAERGVVVGHDHRHHSLRFAQLTAAALLSKGFKVYLFEKLAATPLVPYAALLKKAAAGVMITASHNPKDDNGYKVYWDNGCQIVAPHDKGIAKCIEENLQPWDVDVDALLKQSAQSGRLVDPTADVETNYFTDIQQYSYNKEANAKSELKITYTAMHGVGTPWVAKAFEAFNLPAYIPVEEQIAPHPDFPTVAFPNPEEGKGALKLAIQRADSAGSPLILANDPDADRLAVAEKLDDGSWKVFTGNEIGILLAHWVWQKFSAAHPEVPVDKCVMLNTTVSSKMLSAMAAKEGFHYDETLTGFKWLGSVAADLTSKGYHFLYAFEEAIGFMVGDVCRDKDGVRAAAVFAEMAVELYSQRSTVVRTLHSLYEKYGYYATNNRYFFCYDPALMETIFGRIRNNGQYSEACGPYKIKNIRDLTTGYDSSRPDKKAILPTSSSTHMITFFFENGCVATLRGSGTEPKLKYYIEHHGPYGDSAGIDRELADISHHIIEQFLAPTKNGLAAPAE